MSQRLTENSRSGARAAVWGWIVWYFTPVSGFLFTSLDADIYTTLDPENITAFIVGTAAALGITGGAGAYYNDKTSPAVAQKPNVSPVEPRIEVTEPTTPKTTPAATKPTLRSKPEASKNYFSDVELDCKCIDLKGCDYQGIHAQTLKMANELREHFGPLVVNSAYRCPEHNRRIGGAPASYHVKGMAMDVRSATATPDEMYSWLNSKYPRQYGLGNYKTFVHLDARTSAWARKAGPDQQWRSFENEPVDVELVAA